MKYLKIVLTIFIFKHCLNEYFQDASLFFFLAFDCSIKYLI